MSYLLQRLYQGRKDTKIHRGSTILVWFMIYPIRQSIHEELLDVETHSSIASSSAKRRSRNRRARFLSPRNLPQLRIARSSDLPTWNFDPRPRTADQEELNDVSFLKMNDFLKSIWKFIIVYDSCDICNEVIFPYIYEVFVQLCQSLLEQEDHT